MSVLDLLILSLAVWRVAYFVAKEGGPWNVMGRLRARFGGLTACIYCASVYAAAVSYILYVAVPWSVWIIAASGGAMLLHRYTGGSNID